MNEYKHQDPVLDGHIRFMQKQNISYTLESAL